MAKPKILIIYTGGTIGMEKDLMTGVLEPLDFNHLVSSMPEFQAHSGRNRCAKIRPTYRFQRHGSYALGRNRKHDIQQLQRL